MLGAKGAWVKFCTVINCMDGRVQLPVNKFLQQRFGAEFVDTITEPGPNLILSEQKNRHLTQSIFERLEISIDRHGSVGVAIVGHHDCAGNPAPRDEQLGHLQDSIQLLQGKCGRVEVIGLWVNEEWEVQEITEGKAKG